MRAQLLDHTAYGITPDIDVLALNDGMRAFVTQKIKSLPLETRASALGQAFMRGGVLALRYEQDRTRDARETFNDRSGNCLSFSQLFVALGRAAGLHVRFREDRHIETWSRLGDVLFLNRHVTVWGVQGGDEYDIDFGRMNGNAPKLRQLISDDRARAEYFNNLGAERFATGESAQSIPYFNRALTIDPTLEFAWTNLASALRTLGHLKEAEQALHIATQLEPNSESAMSGLERLYRAQGDTRAADRIGQLLARYRERNPYHHFALAEDALKNRDYETAITHLKAALRANPDEPDFNFELGHAYLAQGNVQQAQKRFQRLVELTRDEDESHIYALRLVQLLHEFGLEPSPTERQPTKPTERQPTKPTERQATERQATEQQATEQQAAQRRPVAQPSS